MDVCQIGLFSDVVHGELGHPCEECALVDSDAFASELPGCTSADAVDAIKAWVGDDGDCVLLLLPYPAVGIPLWGERDWQALEVCKDFLETNVKCELVIVA